MYPHGAEVRVNDILYQHLGTVSGFYDTCLGPSPHGLCESRPENVPVHSAAVSSVSEPNPKP